MDHAYEHYRSVWTAVATESVAAFMISALSVKAAWGSEPANRVVIGLCVAPWLILTLFSMILVGIEFLAGGASRYKANIDAKAIRRGTGFYPNGGNGGFWIAVLAACLSAVIVAILLV